MTFTVLNLDILHNVMSFSDRTSISRLMRTCRTLNHEGAKHLLRDMLGIWNQATAISFTQYAFARADVDQMAHRMHWLRSLYLYAPRGPEESCKKFARTMAFFLYHFAIIAPNFVQLQLGDSEELVSADAAFAEAVGAMVRLRKLTLMNASLQTFKMLSHSHLRLRSVEICAVNEATSPSADPHPVVVLHNSQDTLRVLSLQFVAFDPGLLLPCYQKLVQLDLSIYLVPPVHRLAQAFPNLRTLNVHTWPGFYTLEAAEREETRQTNILNQAQHGTFSALRSYTGSILSLYLFALTCRIRFLELRDDEEVLCWDTRMLQAIYAQTRPAHLELYVSDLAAFLSQADDLVHLFAHRDFGVTQTLNLTLDILWMAKDVDFGQVLECLYSAVRASSLRAVKLALDLENLWDGYFDASLESPPVENFLLSLDLEAVASKLFETTRTLKTAIVRRRTFGAPDVTAQRGPDIDYSDVH